MRYFNLSLGVISSIFIPIQRERILIFPPFLGKSLKYFILYNLFSESSLNRKDILLLNIDYIGRHYNNPSLFLRKFREQVLENKTHVDGSFSAL